MFGFLCLVFRLIHCSHLVLKTGQTQNTKYETLGRWITPRDSRFHSWFITSFIAHCKHSPPAQIDNLPTNFILLWYDLRDASLKSG